MFNSENSGQDGDHFPGFMPEKMFHYRGNFRRFAVRKLESGLHSAPGHGADNQERLLAVRNGVRQSRLRRLERQVLLAGEKSHKRPPLQRLVIANRSTQDRIARFERVEDGTHRDRTGHFEFHVTVHTREIAQMKWKHDTDHFLKAVWWIDG